jgi:4-amino-4-deoxy-L-arabinose transferase-like glycosyltransferase
MDKVIHFYRNIFTFSRVQSSPMSLHLVAISLIVAVLVIRFTGMTVLPLYDTTEARYAEIARIMFETRNWVSPQFNYDQPFWGKPPLHTWITAGGFSVFGISELSARLPHFICGTLVLFLLFRFVRQMKDTSAAVFAVLVLTTSIGFVVAMGMVMTDTALLLSTSIAMFSYWHLWTNREKPTSNNLNGLMFFAALAIGMLVKGPVAIVLVTIALGVWSLWQKNVLKAIGILPWLTGLPLFLLLTLPWYLWAELRTPGFLEYFLVGEHFQRFLVPGWEGDLYGSAHERPKGAIWLYWVATAFPWSIILIVALLKTLVSGIAASPKTSSPKTQASEKTGYFICWMLSPLLLFTLAGNILIAYVLPGFSAMAVILAMHFRLYKSLLFTAASTGVLMCVALAAFISGNIAKTSEVELLGREVNRFQQTELYYWQKRPFSARFYSHGRAKLIENQQALLSVYNQKAMFP